jgi:hypothetical protein
MMFDTEKDTNTIICTPLLNDYGRFRFHTPINDISTLTFSFRSPFSPVEFIPDRYSVTITAINATTASLVFSQDHNVADNELVHIINYSTLDTVIDSTTIAIVNQEKGHIVTFVNDTTLTIEVDLTQVTADATNLASCFIASRRLIIPIRMEYIVQ